MEEGGLQPWLVRRPLVVGHTGCRDLDTLDETPWPATLHATSILRKARQRGWTVRIETQRLVIRSFEEGDVPEYAEIVGDLRVTRYLGDGRPYSQEEATAYIRECIALESEIGFSRYAVLLDGELIGFCGFKPDRDHIDLGWRYAHQHWGHGYATEAARAVLEYGTETLQLAPIVAVSYEDNVASVNVIQKLGFQFVKRTENEHGSLVWYANPL